MVDKYYIYANVTVTKTSGHVSRPHQEGKLAIADNGARGELSPSCVVRVLCVGGFRRNPRFMFRARCREMSGTGHGIGSFENEQVVLDHLLRW